MIPPQIIDRFMFNSPGSNPEGDSNKYEHSSEYDAVVKHQIKPRAGLRGMQGRRRAKKDEELES